MTDAEKALNRLAKWRTLLAGWQLGTRPLGDPECDAVRDQREVLLLLRAEVTALCRAMIEEGVISRERMQDLVAEEADLLSVSYAQRFPGITATDDGLTLTKEAAETMKRMNFKP